MPYELSTNHPTTINELSSMPSELINCQLPAILCCTWETSSGGLEKHKLKKMHFNQVHGERAGLRTLNELRVGFPLFL